MPKRKLEEISGTDAISNGPGDRQSDLKRQQLDGLLDQGKKTLFQSLKVARGFERQKLGRRQKTAKTENNDADSARLNAEVSALKSLDLATTAELHLYKTLLKIKTVASAPSFPQYVHSIVDGSRRQLDAASANVQARLFKSSPVQESMAKALNLIRALLGIEDVKADKKKRLRAKDYQNSDAGKSPSLETTLRAKTTPGSATQSDDELMQSPDITNKQIYLVDEAAVGNKIAEESEDDFDMYASRLAASSDEDSTTDHSESDVKWDEDLNPEIITEDSAHESTLSDDLEQEALPHKKPKKPPSTAPKSTTFLPSLSTGYFSGSESAEGLSTDDDGRNEQRKNRMGQQARRALWEKKFGKNANHVKKQPLNRDEGWDARRGASASNERGRRGRGRGGGDMARGRDQARGGRRPIGSGANSEVVVVKKAKPVSETPLHPSWEAARKAKEQTKVTAFQGKKVVFD